MSLPAGSAGLSLDQAPPLSIPAGFFLLAPVAMAAVGVALTADPAILLVSRALPATIAVAHVGTLGFLLAVMLGALYQMIPVVAGVPVPAERGAHVVQAALALAAVGLPLAFATGAGGAWWLAVQAALVVALVFLGPAGWALWRAPSRTPTVRGMTLAVLGLAGLVVVGVGLAAGRAAGVFVGDADAWTAVHVALALVVWVGGLLTAVSWQILPMFYLAAEVPRWTKGAVLLGVAWTLVAVPLAWLAGAGRDLVLGLAAPGALVVWVLHPLFAVLSLRRRRRRRVDESMPFWYAGMAMAPLVLGAAALAAFGDGLEAALSFGWLAVSGWAGLVMHGMLTRIVAFLVWFHRFSPRVGLERVPAMRDLWPARRVRLGFAPHVAAVVLGALAPWTGSGPLARVAGVSLAIAAVVLGVSMVSALRRR